MRSFLLCSVKVCIWISRQVSCWWICLTTSDGFWLCCPCLKYFFLTKKNFQPEVQGLFSKTPQFLLVQVLLITVFNSACFDYLGQKKKKKSKALNPRNLVSLSYETNFLQTHVWSWKPVISCCLMTGLLFSASTVWKKAVQLPFT